jgi:hypothetical protein
MKFFFSILKLSSVKLIVTKKIINSFVVEVIDVNILFYLASNHSHNLTEM